MGILEQVKVLEAKLDKEIDLAKRLVDENTQLKEKVELYQRRIEDLEALIHVFKEEQVAIENGILSALNRLNQFEDAVEKRLSPESAGQETTEGAGWPAGDSKEEAAVTNGEPESSPQDDAE